MKLRSQDENRTMQRLVADALLTQTKTLPNSEASVNSTGFDLGTQSGQQTFPPGVELLVKACAGHRRARRCGHDDLHGTARGLVRLLGRHDLAGSVIVQTGAGGAGAAATEARVTLPGNVKRYLRVRATNSGAGNARPPR